VTGDDRLHFTAVRSTHSRITHDLGVLDPLRDKLMGHSSPHRLTERYNGASEYQESLTHVKHLRE